MLIEMVDLH